MELPDRVRDRLASEWIELDVLGRVVARNLKILCPDPNSPCDCGLTTGEACPCKAIKRNPGQALNQIRGLGTMNEIDLAPLVLDLVGSVQELSFQAELLKAQEQDRADKERVMRAQINALRAKVSTLERKK